MDSEVDPNKQATELEDGTIEIIDKLTGHVIETLPSYEDRALIAGRNSFNYSPFLGDIIIERMAKGTALTDLEKLPGFPAIATITRWMAAYPEFRNKFKMARKVLAIRSADLFLKVSGVDLEKGTSDDSFSRDQVACKKLQMDGLRWFAEKTDPGSFTTKSVMHSGDPDQPMRFVIETGIRREDEQEQLEGQLPTEKEEKLPDVPLEKQYKDGSKNWGKRSCRSEKVGF